MVTHVHAMLDGLEHIVQQILMNVVQTLVLMEELAL